jgi:hypothetical protein
MDEHTVHFRPPPWLPILVALILGGAFVVGKTIETRGYEPVTISVSSEGKVSAVPNIANLTFGVQTGPLPTAKDAMGKLEKNMTAVLAAVKGQGIEEKDIATQSLWLNPVYDWTAGKQVLRGYQASHNLSVKVHDLDKVSDVLTAATNAGANEIGGVSFAIDDPEALRAQAREKAITQAQEKARVLAQDLGMRLGDLKGFSEGGGLVIPVPYMMERAIGLGGEQPPSVPVPAGEQEITVEVTLMYELK